MQFPINVPIRGTNISIGGGHIFSPVVPAPPAYPPFRSDQTIGPIISVPVSRNVVLSGGGGTGTSGGGSVNFGLGIRF